MSAADNLLASRSREPARHSMTTRVVIYGLLVFFAFVYLIPMVVMVMTSLKPLDEVTGGNMLPGNLQEIVTGLKPGAQVVANALVLQNTVEQ